MYESLVADILGRRTELFDVSPMVQPRPIDYNRYGSGARISDSLRRCPTSVLRHRRPEVPGGPGRPVAPLFPRALHMAGWKHLIDNLIQRGLCSLPWFPVWLTRYKSLIGFLRQTPVVTQVCRVWRSRGMNGAASILQAATFPSFANWRWGTLDWCVVVKIFHVFYVTNHHPLAFLLELRHCLLLLKRPSR